jgi:RHS repeat-associated protein
MGCIKLDILDQQYKRTELKVSNFKKELTPKLQTEKVYIYLLHGESWIDQRNTGWNAMYTFSGKERDEETGYSYFGSRYYNSDLSIWLSVDPQAGRYPSLSPYAYCANNPVMYTDPNGEFFWIPMVIGAVVYGIANTVIHHSQGDINNFWQGLGYFALGAINGAIAGATWSAGIAGIQAASTFANVAGWTMIGAKAVNAVSTIASGIANTENAWQIMWGKAYVDNIGQAFLRNSWEGLQTWAGYNFTQFRNAAGDVDKVERWGGATFAIAENVTDFRTCQ